MEQPQIKLTAIWPEVKNLIEDGMSLIPVRDKAEGNRAAKTPCIAQWKQYQSERMNEGELWQAMETYDTTAIAIITGEVSGRLELIDIDSKYEPGVEALLLQDIAKLYPDLFHILRIHKTPSGGRHIIYRIEDGDVPGNQKLAGRERTEDEIAEERKAGKSKPSRTVNFLETRGEGGYFLYPPSMGYSVVQDVPVPLLTWEERCGLINLCRSYDRIVKVAPTPKPTKREDDWYTENPFEDFNNNCDPIQLMEQYGWKALPYSNNRFIWFTRPGKDNGVSASFNQSKRVFYIFTSSTDLDSERGYNPASILAELGFNGDKKLTFSHLVDSGYGKVKHNVEQSIIKKAAIQGNSIPANFSEEAKAQHAELTQQHHENHPFGTFWDLNKEGDFVINIESFIHVATQLGFRSFNNIVIQIDGNYVNKVDDIYLYDLLKDYIKMDDDVQLTNIKAAYEKFLKTYGGFITTKRLPAFDSDNVLSDTADTCYKFYSNLYVEITSTNIRLKEYESLDGNLVWVDKIMPREYNDKVAPSALYRQYLINSTDPHRQSVQDHVKSVIGWLCHDYNSPARIYIAVLTEMVMDPKDGGGSGKNIFVNVLSNMIGVSTASGSMVKWDDKFFAVWKPSDRVYFIPDIPKVVDWLFLKNAVENPLVNKKYDREISVSIDQTPKVVINTNYSYADLDGGLKRRIIPIEFTNFYTLNGGVDGVHGKLFPSRGVEGTWDKEDWKGFDDFVIHCIQYNLQQDGKLSPTMLSEEGWVKKFVNMYGEDNYDFISDNIQYWMEREIGPYSGWVKVDDFQKQYDDYVSALKERYKLSKKRLMTAVRDFCERFGLSFECSVQKRINGTKARYHIFSSGDVGGNLNEDEDDDGIPF
ncbi:bifunctional DNA primase/polymerase [Sphingobacterium kyonggiense]